MGAYLSCPSPLGHSLWRTSDVYVIKTLSIRNKTMKAPFVIAALLTPATSAGPTETTCFADSSGRSQDPVERFGDSTLLKDAHCGQITSTNL